MKYIRPLFSIATIFILIGCGPAPKEYIVASNEAKIIPNDDVVESSTEVEQTLNNIFEIKWLTIYGLQFDYAGYLTISITDPAGTEIILSDGSGGSYDFDGDYNFREREWTEYQLDDNPPVTNGKIDTSPYTYYGVAEGQFLSNMEGDPVNGTWTLKIGNDSNFYSGSFDGWDLGLTYFE